MCPQPTSVPAAGPSGSCCRSRSQLLELKTARQNSQREQAVDWPAYPSSRFASATNANDAADTYGGREHIEAAELCGTGQRLSPLCSEMTLFQEVQHCFPKRMLRSLPFPQCLHDPACLFLFIAPKQVAQRRPMTIAAGSAHTLCITEAGQSASSDIGPCPYPKRASLEPDFEAFACSGGQACVLAYPECGGVCMPALASIL
eukprot:4383654-Pleurochrysis_carterae.AAC.1